MSEAFVGEIRQFGFNFNPKNWAACAGQILPIAQNTALFSLLGTTYGGNGTTTFALPDLRSRTPLNQGNGPGLSPQTIGEQSGTETVTVLSNQMPQHSHSVSASPGSDSGSAANAFPGNDGRTPYNIYNSTTDGTKMNPQMTSMAGGNQPHNNLQPYLCVNFCICLSGIFPSRN